MASEQTVVCEPTAWMKEKRAGMSFEARADDVTRDGADHDSLLRHSIELQPSRLLKKSRIWAAVRFAASMQ